MPDVEEREAILKIHSSKVPLSTRVDLKRIARATPGCSGADIANIVNEAALYAARNNRDLVQMTDFEEARDKILMGVARRSRAITPEEKKKTAYHEAGHALLHYYLEHADPLNKVTVVPRGQAGGVTFSLPETDIRFYGRGWALDRIKILYGGYVAEELVFSETTSGPQSDLKQATNLARRMVTEWGMGDLGPVAFGQEDEPIFLGKEIARHKDYSEETAREIDAAVRKIMSSCLDETTRLLTENRHQLDQLAEALIERETLTDAEVRDLLGMPERDNAGDLSGGDEEEASGQ
jgi:cell division protease FtsH